MSKDTIYREDAIKAIAETIASDGDTSAWLYIAEDMLKNAPSADRTQGKWKRKIVDSGFNADWVCSECGYRVMTDYVSFNFCPNCGCQMKGADDDD